MGMQVSLFCIDLYSFRYKWYGRILPYYTTTDSGVVGS
jgi:hypothetical protein